MDLINYANYQQSALSLRDALLVMFLATFPEIDFQFLTTLRWDDICVKEIQLRLGSKLFLKNQSGIMVQVPRHRGITFYPIQRQQFVELLRIKRKMFTFETGDPESHINGETLIFNMKLSSLRKRLTSGFGGLSKPYSNKDF